MPKRGRGQAQAEQCRRYAFFQFYKGDSLTGAKVHDTLVDPVAAVAAKGKPPVYVTVPTLSADVSGTLQPGDIVSVIVG